MVGDGDGKEGRVGGDEGKVGDGDGKEGGVGDEEREIGNDEDVGNDEEMDMFSFRVEDAPNLLAQTCACVSQAFSLLFSLRSNC